MPNPSSHLTAVTYNVHQWVGTDKRYDPSRGLSVLKEMSADIIGLQEVNFPKQIKHKITADKMAEELEMELIFGETLLRRQASYGNVLLTSLPVKNVRRHDISVRSYEPRGVLDIDLHSEKGLIRVMVTHLGLWGWERRRQHKMLGELLKTDSGTDTTILMGDFNEWLPLRFPFRRISDWFGHVPAPLTFPTFCPVLSLDRILISPDKNIIEVHTHKSKRSRQASDHYPVVATFTLG